MIVIFELSFSLNFIAATVFLLPLRALHWFPLGPAFIQLLNKVLLILKKQFMQVCRNIARQFAIPMHLIFANDGLQDRVSIELFVLSSVMQMFKHTCRLPVNCGWSEKFNVIVLLAEGGGVPPK